MPELPEVEVLRRSLEGHLIGARVERVEVRDARLREPVDRRRLSSRLGGQSLERLRRRAKYLLIDVTGDHTLIVHLGMSGRLTLAPGGHPLEPHEHVSFYLDTGRRLCFRDPRRFGLVLTLPTEDVAADRRFRDLGVEPLGGEFDGACMMRLAAGRRGPVKSFLMNGRLIVGVGNIYAAEALFAAGIHPRRSVARIGAGSWHRLAESVRTVLGAAIEQGGTTLNDFRDGDGSPGYFQVSLSVYGREGEDCVRCGRQIRRVVQTGRSTFYCPGCQR